MRLFEDQEAPLELNILPMIDVIFSILAMFIITSIFLTRIDSLPVNLPNAQSATPQKSTPVTLTINPAGAIAFNRQPVELNNLKPLILQQQQLNPEIVVVVNADEQVNHGRVVEVMDLLRQMEGVKLAIATKKP
jgi:biopolymer transport protein ExbD